MKKKIKGPYKGFQKSDRRVFDHSPEEKNSIKLMSKKLVEYVFYITKSLKRI